jgi:hypothetical protein
MIIQPSRRGFITGLTSLLAAPALVRAESLMPVKVIPFEPYMLLRGTTPYSTEIEEVRIYESATDPASFVSADFFKRYEEAAGRFLYQPEQVGIALTREDEKAMRMVDVVRPEAFALGRSEPEPYAFQDMRRDVNPSQYANLKHRGLL